MSRVADTTVASGGRHRRLLTKPSLRVKLAGTQPEPDEPGPARTGAMRVWVAQSGLSAFVLGLVLHLRYGYSAGDRDHTVLSPLGMQAANPDWFAGDWAIANAPQPHWHFDVLTWLGTKTGTLAGIYFAYWALALIVFGATTTLLAHTWARRYTWPAVALVTLLASVSPPNVLGTGSSLYSVALPNVLGGSLLYLTCAALLIGRHRLAAIAGVATAVIHVQQGAVTAVLLGVMAAVFAIRSRRAGEASWRRSVDPALFIGAVAAFVVVVVELRLRPVAGHLSDFAQACNEIIPYHCDASTWTRQYVLGGAALVGLALATYVFLDRDRFLRWAIVLVLPAIGLLIGLAFDLFNVPVLGMVAQGVNVYRLMLVLMPFAFWGVLTPILGDLSPRRRWSLLAYVLLLGVVSLQLAWAVDNTAGLRAGVTHLAFGGAFVLAVVAMTVPGLIRQPARLVGGVIAAMALIVAGLAAVGGALQRTPLQVSVYPYGLAASWGERVQEVVPVGSQILIPPQVWSFRMLTKRAVVIDCKYGPYGGEPWQEFKARIDALGGFGQCLGEPGAPNYSNLPAEQLVEVANRYGAEYIMVEARNSRRWQTVDPNNLDALPEPIMPAQGRVLVANGWTILLEPELGAPYYLLKSPDA